MQLRHHTAIAAEEAAPVVEGAAALQPMLQLAPQIVLECGLHLVSIILHHFIFQGHQQRLWVPSEILVIHLHHLPVL
jgi:hypothetical protein